MSNLGNVVMQRVVDQAIVVACLAEGPTMNVLIRPCADCGLWTGNYCDHCYAADRYPDQQWAAGQMTPLCTDCDQAHDACHFCRREMWCTHAPWDYTLEGIRQWLERNE